MNPALSGAIGLALLACLPGGTSAAVARARPGSVTTDRTNAAPPQLAAEESNDERITVHLRGDPNALYGLEVSHDLKRWTNWLTARTDSSGRLVAIGEEIRPFFVRAISGPAASGRGTAEIALGKRLFSETRFAQYFFAHSQGGVNQPLTEGDPVMDNTLTTTNALIGPFRGQSMNCRACHLLDEHQASHGNRTYADFARRSPVPDRGDGRPTATRNSPPLVNASLRRGAPFLLHYDGEFPSGPALVIGTFTGRNFGWLPSERDQAVQHIARVIREDDGRASLAAEMGGAYRTVLAGIDPSIPVQLRLPPEYRIDVNEATDDQILHVIARLVNAFLESLTFMTNAEGEFDGSPYDAFLRRNNLPRKPGPAESDLQYGDRLLELLKVTPDLSGGFTTLRQPFVFGEKELQGLKVFLTRPTTAVPGTRDGVGNCIACHPPPAFTDFRFHNSGVAQDEYDIIHGPEKFAALPIPPLQQRQQDPAAFLPPSPAHPNASGRFLSPPSRDKPGYTDLGLWNVFANPGLPAPQEAIRSLLRQKRGDLTEDALLPLTVALFKTTGLRDLGQSAPYFHTGTADTLADVIDFYREISRLSRNGSVLNGDPELSGIVLSPLDMNALEAFLQALNEDYP